MTPTNLQQLADWAGGTVAAGNPLAVCSRVCTDSRTVQRGDFFVALRGERFDGHGYLAAAAAAGATGALVDAQYDGGVVPGLGMVRVQDTLGGLQQMAGAYRRTLSFKVVGITGSNGKTSTKDFCRAVLSVDRSVVSTRGNLNNHIGLPLSLLEAGPEHGAGVFEMGMNHAGEIAPLAALAAPDYGIITNIGVAHIENLGSQEAIAQEKGELATALREDGLLVLSAEDRFSDAIAARTKARAVRCGIGCGDVQALDLREELGGSRFVARARGCAMEAWVPVAGRHMVRNALMAVAVGLEMGQTLEACVQGLAGLELTRGRLERKRAGGVEILDDTYNANPDSVEAALRTLAALPCGGRRVAVLGRMGELGAFSEEGHARVGRVAGELGLDLVVGVGEEPADTVAAARAAGVGEAVAVSGVEEAVEHLKAFLNPGDHVLVKGSRSARMERVVERLLGA
jgi:UDP-N-acetylmuramoyl-tripeptide--D-alanyl-D-alanine ligase